MNEQRRLLVVSGPSGAGKDTVVKYLMEAHPEIEISVSATTRAMRPGEAEGVNYYYMTNAQFEEKLAHGEILEHVNYCGKYYGTPKSEARWCSFCRPAWKSWPRACAGAAQRTRPPCKSALRAPRKSCAKRTPMILPL